MSSISEIENAIRKLSADELSTLVRWIDSIRRDQQSSNIDQWLAKARGGATVPEMTTDRIMSLTRGE